MDRPRCFGIKYDYYNNLHDKCPSCPKRDPCEVEINRRDEEEQEQQIRDLYPRRSKLIDKIKKFLAAHPNASRHDVLIGVNYQRYGGIEEFRKAEDFLRDTLGIKIKRYIKVTTPVTSELDR